jgi:DNA repair protein RecO (recombination protein O)
MSDKVFQAESIILRQYEFAETDRLLVVLTADHGKLRGIAKGVRKPASRMMGHCELFTRTSMKIARGGELYTISQSEQIEPHLILREDLERGAYAHYVVELLDRFTEYEEPARAIFNLMRDVLAWLATPDIDPHLAVRFFEIRLLGLVGFQPSLFYCAVGQEDIEAQDQYFSVMDGGAVCPDHIRGRAVLPMSLTALKMLRYMQTREFEAVSKVKVGEALHAELERILQSYVIHLLEMRLKSAEFIRLVRHRS